MSTSLAHSYTPNSRLRLVLAAVILGLLSLNGFSRPGMTLYQIVSEALACLAGVVLFAQALLDQQKERAVEVQHTLRIGGVAVDGAVLLEDCSSHRVLSLSPGRFFSVLGAVAGIYSFLSQLFLFANATSFVGAAFLTPSLLKSQLAEGCAVGTVQ